MRHHRHIPASLILCVGLALLVGCGDQVEPRVIADRVFEGDRIAVTLTSFPNQPVGLEVESVAKALLSDEFTYQPPKPTCVEKLPAVRLVLLPAEGANRIVADIRTLYAGQKYLVSVTFVRREISVAAEGGRVMRWVADGESIIQTGSTVLPVPPPAGMAEAASPSGRDGHDLSALTSLEPCL